MDRLDANRTLHRANRCAAGLGRKLVHTLSVRNNSMVNDAGRALGPGLKKAFPRLPFCARTETFVRSEDRFWRELFDHADVISEGSVRQEKNGRTWFGSSSIILTLSTASPELRTFLIALARRDLHVRLRAIRLACREAYARAAHELRCVRCDLRIVSDERGIRIDVDVEAPFKERVAATRG